MIGYLPTTLEVAGKEYSICSDYRVALVILRHSMTLNLTIMTAWK